MTREAFVTGQRSASFVRRSERKSSEGGKNGAGEAENARRATRGERLIVSDAESNGLRADTRNSMRNASKNRVARNNAIPIGAQTLGNIDGAEINSANDAPQTAET